MFAISINNALPNHNPQTFASQKPHNLACKQQYCSETSESLQKLQKSRWWHEILFYNEIANSSRH